MKLISIVIPVYRNQGALLLTYNKIIEIYLEELSENYSIEIIFINDGSDDQSINEIKNLHSNDPRVRYISFTRNFGQHSATIAGYRYAKGNAIITLSADLQDPVNLIPKMIKKWVEGSQIVICYREGREDSLLSKIFSKIVYSVLKLSYPKLPTGGFDYFLLSRKVIDTVNSFGTKTKFLPGDLLWSGYSVSMIPYIRMKRLIGKSQYNFWKKFKLFLDIFLDASHLPIRLITSAGVIIALCGFIYALLVTMAWYYNETPFTGWAPIIISIFIVGGINIIMVGLLGEYIWRIYDELKRMPPYIIEEYSDEDY